MKINIIMNLVVTLWEATQIPRNSEWLSHCNFNQFFFFLKKRIDKLQWTPSSPSSFPLTRNNQYGLLCPREPGPVWVVRLLTNGISIHETPFSKHFQYLLSSDVWKMWQLSVCSFPQTWNVCGGWVLPNISPPVSVECDIGKTTGQGLLRFWLSFHCWPSNSISMSFSSPSLSWASTYEHRLIYIVINL